MEPRHLDAPRRRGTGAELWILRPGADDELDARVRAFEGETIRRVLSPPAGRERLWAEAFARALVAPLEHHAELHAHSPGSPSASGAVWRVLCEVLGRTPGRVLAVLELEALAQAVDAALELPGGRRGYRVDPGRLVLLLDAPGGPVLRRSNVLAPDGNAGTALPGGSAR